MSANNELQIQKHNGKFRIANVDDGGGFFIDNVEYPTLEEAIKAANEYMKEEIVEHGLSINL